MTIKGALSVAAGVADHLANVRVVWTRLPREHHRNRPRRGYVGPQPVEVRIMDEERLDEFVLSRRRLARVVRGVRIVQKLLRAVAREPEAKVPVAFRKRVAAPRRDGLPPRQVGTRVDHPAEGDTVFFLVLFEHLEARLVVRELAEDALVLRFGVDEAVGPTLFRGRVRDELCAIVRALRRCHEPLRHDLERRDADSLGGSSDALHRSVDDAVVTRAVVAARVRQLEVREDRRLRAQRVDQMFLERAVDDGVLERPRRARDAHRDPRRRAVRLTQHRRYGLVAAADLGGLDAPTKEREEAPGEPHP
mmetsp:Transcript_14968/g.44658  ORF Transcript_14968/g.44658 Transcript_14968/m.44658 type:complete len:306 (+) Transcript_14968:111-1028(+)